MIEMKYREKPGAKGILDQVPKAGEWHTDMAKGTKLRRIGWKGL